MPWMSFSSTQTDKMAKNPEHAYVTLLMTDNYLPGALVLAHSLKDNGTTKQLVAMVTLDTISVATIEELKTVYDQVIPVERVTNESPGNLYLMGREDLASTFSKICLWKLGQFKRVVYLDADIVALRAADELFDLQSRFAAAPDVGWPDIFNSGVMALTPNLQDYYALQALARNGVSFDGADQGLLNMHFTRNSWERLSFTYNCTPSGNYQYAPAYRHFGSQISLVHFIGRQKPWRAGRHYQGSGGVYSELTARWWAVYDAHYRGTNNQAISGQAPARNRTIQQHVTGEANTYDLGYSSSVSKPTYQVSIQSQSQGYQQPQSQASPVPTMTIHPPSPPHQQPHVHNVEHRFSAPQVQWDPARAPPPAESLPEAANFPSNVYTMSEDVGLYQPPQTYPDPPKDMWYEVPKEKPQVFERPRVIFPWEATQARATRVFPKDPSPPPIPDPDRKPPEMPTLDTSGSEVATEPSAGPSQPAQPAPVSIAQAATKIEDFASYSRTNAWDNDPGITRYMESFNSRRKARHSPASSITSIGKDRRPSLLLTDFPDANERPSLPVTPAPIRRTTLWGTDAEDLPPAEGVPSQDEWDPTKQLEVLQRRQSETFLAGPGNTKTLSSREEISSAVPDTIQEEAAKQRVSDIASPIPIRKDKPVFTQIDVASQDGASEKSISPDSSAIGTAAAAAKA